MQSRYRNTDIPMLQFRTVGPIPHDRVSSVRSSDGRSHLHRAVGLRLIGVMHGSRAMLADSEDQPPS